MKLHDFDYRLPDKLIATHPLEQRDASRMLVVDRVSSSFSDTRFQDLPAQLSEGDVLVVNNTKVFPARLVGQTDTGARVEILLVEEVDPKTWTALARPAKRLRPGRTVAFGDELNARVINRESEGMVLIEFQQSVDIWATIERIGHTPLPHYLKRDVTTADREKYQTVYAKTRGAIAAPTAGLHFSDQVVGQLMRKGVEMAEITLHVGYGTFEPVRVVDVSQHKVLPERFEITESAAERLNKARSEHRRIIAVGTTTTRALETAFDVKEFLPMNARTDLTITPGYRFRAVDALLTNFHLPKSSLLILVSTFGGHELIMRAYQHAVAERYRFFSYGDCMFIQ